ncbi:hypothetical protein Acr_01g0004080 [Actinidia rufa]|uniref:Uncharacterized protein n=1 Tax=Actinidia rufa TaxID=165716 RepID=A0A7J0E3V8_9ERIC|nr:hypothetical protein Acr_01g0004080 [Actinidia rufa]
MAVTTITDLHFYGVALLVCSISALLLRYLRHPKAKAVVNHPPGPPALPIIGHLHLLGAILSKSLQGLASRYGPIMKISIASSSAIVVSNEIFAREMLKTHEMVFVSRPHFGASDFNIYQGSEFVNAGKVWDLLAIHEEAVHDGASLGPTNQQVRRHPEAGDYETRGDPRQFLDQVLGYRPWRGADGDDQQRDLQHGDEHALLLECRPEQGDSAVSEGRVGPRAQVQFGGDVGPTGEIGPVWVREEAQGAVDAVRRPGGGDYGGT